MLLLPRIARRYFIFVVLGLCGLYLLGEFLLNTYLMISVDEFWFAHRIYQYKFGLPYRDFAPYKTVSGYYLLLLPLLFSHGIPQALISIKNVLALLNTAVLFIASLWLSRFFSRSAILISLALLILSETFLTYSTQIRVDLLSYWLGLFSLLFLLEKRPVFAGLMLGLAFTFSQKVIWYAAASNAALLFDVYYHELENKKFGSRSKISLLDTSWLHKLCKNLFLFNATFFLPIALYILCWSITADSKTVLNSLFHEAAIMYRLDTYDQARTLFWSIIIYYNPLLFLLWPATLVTLFIAQPDPRAYRLNGLVVVYALTVLCCLIPYKQVFPYYMQVTFPVFFVLYAAFFTWLIKLFREATPPVLLLPSTILIALTGLLLILISSILCKFDLPLVDLLIPAILAGIAGFAVVPRFMHGTQLKNLISPLIAISFVFTGVIYPAFTTLPKYLSLNGSYQKANLRAISTLLQPDGDYLAGIELIYNKNQPIAGLRHLMLPAVEFLAHPTPALRTVMLASLYEDPDASIASVIRALKLSPVKFYVNNYRIAALPQVIKDVLDTEYAHLWGSIYLYAPLIPSGHRVFELKFAGKYRIDAVHPVKINGHLFLPQTQAAFAKKLYISDTAYPFRLRLLVDIHTSQLLSSSFQQDEPERMLI